MKSNLRARPHTAPRWIRNAELIGPVAPSLLDGKPLTRKEKEQGYEDLVLPDLYWNAVDRRRVRALQKLGVRTIRYISFSIRTIPPPERTSKPRGKRRSNERGWRGERSFLARRPELAIYDNRGVRQRCIFADQNSPYRIEICPNTAGVVEELDKEVRRIMASGVDAIFIDHVFGVSQCHGERLGVHEHLYHERDIRHIPEEHLRFAPGTEAPNDDPLSNFAYAMLLKRLRKVVAQYGPDKAIVGNTTFWPFKYTAKLRKCVLFAPVIHRRVPELFWRYLDCGMVESYMLVPKSWTSPDSSASSTVRWQSYADWEREAAIPEQYRALGRRLIALPYAGRRTRREDLSFAYAAARLDDLIWMGGSPRGTAMFCRFRLGRPTGEKRRAGAALWRPFEHGLVALNPSEKPIELCVPVPWPQVIDLYSGRAVRCHGEFLRLRLPADSGRVLLKTPS